MRKLTVLCINGQRSKEKIMAKSMYCPICDQPVKGRFCMHCKEFVTPYERDVDYHMNESHDPKKDADCEYHGTGSVQPAQPAPADDRERMEQAKKSFESNGAVRTVGTGGSKKTNFNPMVVIWGVLICFLIGVVAGMINRQNTSDDKQTELVYEDEVSSLDSEEKDDIDDDNMAFPFTQSYGEGYLSDEEYQKLLAENGFDEDGYKDVDYEEVLAAGEPCNGWKHFDLTSRTASRHIRSALEDADIAASNFDADVEPDNYYYMNRYGEIESYFQSYLYVTLDDDSYESGYSGFLYLVSDSVTDELMAVCVKDDDLNVFMKTCRAIMIELDEEDKYEIMANVIFDINAALKEEDGYQYLEYGNLWFDFSYYDEIPEDDYQYTGWIYLGDNGEEE